MATLARARCVWTGVDGSPWYTNMFFALEPGQEQDAVDTLTYFVSGVQLYVQSAVTWTVEDLVTFINPGTGMPIGAALANGSTGAGGNSGQMLSRSSQGLIRWNTGAYPAGRQIVGHTYIPGLAEAANGDNGRMLEATRASLESIANATITTPGNATPVVYSRKNRQGYAAQNAQCWREFAVLRSRRD